MNIVTLLYAVLGGALSLVAAILVVGFLVSFAAKTPFGRQVLRHFSRALVFEYWKQILVAAVVVSLGVPLFGWSITTVAIICAAVGAAVPLVLILASKQ
ncbi:MAG: hypothetical protein K2W82_11345 [Candidatus Obscuribacterales bacterium]|jgi:hypothetical protein|nr:hypothetical protein [Candidatus Obscuribacterales bacterium]